MGFTIRCVVTACSNSVELPPIAGDRLSLEPLVGWATDDDGWHCPEHIGARLAALR